MIRLPLLLLLALPLAGCEKYFDIVAFAAFVTGGF